MEMSTEFRNAVENNNIRLVRIMLKDRIMIDPTFDTFNKLFEYANEHLKIPLCENYNGKSFISNKAYWNKKYFNEQIVELLYNFSTERINHIKDICEVIYADEIDKIKKKRNFYVDINKQIAIANEKQRIQIQERRKKINIFKGRSSLENSNSKKIFDIISKEEINRRKLEAEINEATNKKDIIKIRKILIKSIQEDNKFNLFEELMSFVEKRIDNVYEPFEGDYNELYNETFNIKSISKSKLSIIYGKYINSLEKNFSKERVDILKKISRKIN